MHIILNIYSEERRVLYFGESRIILHTPVGFVTSSLQLIATLVATLIFVLF